MQEGTGPMKGQTGLQRVMRFLGFSSDLAVEQRLDNLQPYFSIESGKDIQEPPRMASESLQRRDDRVFDRRSITWSILLQSHSDPRNDGTAERLDRNDK